MRPFSSLVTVEEARSAILANVSPILEPEILPIEEACERVVAVDIKAKFHVPPFDRSGMDGFAVRAEDTYGAGEFSPRSLKLVGGVKAGEEPSIGLRKGEAIEVATGAPIPNGANAVVMVEKTQVEADTVRVFEPVHPQENVSLMGSDIERGTTVLRKGDYLHHGKIGVLSALGMKEVLVYRKPTLAIIPTGEEICELGQMPTSFQVFDVNSYTLLSLAQKNGCEAMRYSVVEDTLEGIGEALDKAERRDCVIFSGGSSVGERDILVDVLAQRGEVLFHGVQMKPGKPTLCGKVGGKLVMGLPGYPAACLMVGHALLAPALRKMASLPERRVEAHEFPLSRRVVSSLGRHQFLTVKIVNGEATPVFKESGAITSLGDAEGYVEIPANVDFLEKGESVKVKFF
ncbi:MAG: gephyrin-like molybdotransferase Glp [Thermoplasmata archaeon]